MVDYDPSEPWTLSALALFLKIREKRGFHQIYPNGFVRTADYEIDLPNIFFNGWTARIFMRRTKRLPGVAVHAIYSSAYYCKTEIDLNGKFIRTLQKGYDPEQNKALSSEIKAGDIYSMGIRIMSDKFFVSVANDVSSSWMNMGSKIKASDYLFKIWTRSDVILSIHMSEEVENDYYRLPWFYDLPYSQQPPGSSIIALLECDKPQQETNVSIDTEGGGARTRAVVNYGKVSSLQKSQTFFVYVRNLPENYTVATSFNPEPKKVAHKSAKNNIYLYRPENCSTLRLTQYIILGAES
ncbi:uncharacterized protein LOC142581993 [Dermacentor variabilis]|uniref:uncharacterized protein LOC142581993 n=1 Tax=Dermacentor variabilis TaxID=34621 RepID=UPI003F5B0590